LSDRDEASILLFHEIFIQPTPMKMCSGRVRVVDGARTP
jgi:hypothetical protein